MPFPLQSSAWFDLILRPAVEADLPFLARLYASTREAEVAQTGWPAEMQQNFLEQQHNAQHAHYTTHYAHAERAIIERGGEAIGRLYWYAGASDVHIVDISLLPQARGRGIGSALLEDLFAYADSLRKGVSIYVERTNPARALYLRLGFAANESEGVYDFMRRPLRGTVN